MNLPTSETELEIEEDVVLLVDDDEIVRKVLRRQLDGKGFKILEADSGEQAIAILKRETQFVNLLITDVTMPDMTGPELARRWTAEVPGTPVLFISGFSESSLAGNELLASGRADFLGKPFSAQAFLAKVVFLLRPPLCSKILTG